MLYDCDATYLDVIASCILKSCEPYRNLMIDCSLGGWLGCKEVAKFPTTFTGIKQAANKTLILQHSGFLFWKKNMKFGLVSYHDPCFTRDVLHFTWINFPLVVQASDTASSYLQAGPCLREPVEVQMAITPYYTLEIHMEPKDGGLKKMIFLTTTWKFAPSFPGHALYIITFYHLKDPQGLITRA